MKTCLPCNRGPQFQANCSHVDCPHRKHVMSLPAHHEVQGSGMEGYQYRTRPTTVDYNLHPDE